MIQCDQCGVDIVPGKEVRKGLFKKRTLCPVCSGKKFSLDVPMG